MNKPSIPKGTRDFGAEEMRRRNYIFETIRSVFALYGFEQIETPAMEQLTTLTGKYGVEGDRLLFKILNSGDYKAGIDAETFTEESPAALAARLCERGLRYDLTVPFARYVVMHRNELTFPFKRYQIQKVWRGERPRRDASASSPRLRPGSWCATAGPCRASTATGSRARNSWSRCSARRWS